MITESFGDGTYWLASNNGPAVGFISIDLGSAFRLGLFELFNTHNGSVNDRGTGDFEIRGSNDAGFSTFTTLVSGTLAAQSSANDPIDAQRFAANSTGQFRYIQFRALSVASAQQICCGIQRNYGLNELRVFSRSAVGAIPEPGTWAMMIVGFGFIGGILRQTKPKRVALHYR